MPLADALDGFTVRVGGDTMTDRDHLTQLDLGEAVADWLRGPNKQTLDAYLRSVLQADGWVRLQDADRKWLCVEAATGRMDGTLSSEKWCFFGGPKHNPECGWRLIVDASVLEETP